jgi:methylated-DNA-protein-cysteine methyltransferase related protein
MRDFYEAVYAVVRTIPRGRVMTYGQIAALLGSPRAARAVGFALRAGGRYDDIPWQRVINRHGAVSARGETDRPHRQRILLGEEGVEFDARGRCDLARCRWEPEESAEIAPEILCELPFR